MSAGTQGRPWQELSSVPHSLFTTQAERTEASGGDCSQGRGLRDQTAQLCCTMKEEVLILPCATPFQPDCEKQCIPFMFSGAQNLPEIVLCYLSNISLTWTGGRLKASERTE